MAEDGRNKVGYLTTYGLRTSWYTPWLHQISSEDYSGSDPRDDCRSQSMSPNFASAVVLMGLTTSQRPEQNEISLALVPRDHPIIPYSNLEAEASGLLDRLLNVFEENSGYVAHRRYLSFNADKDSDALIVTATLNSLATLVRTRASIANKIVSTVLAFNPFALAQAHSPYTTKTKLMVRSITRTVIAFLFNITKKHPQHPLAARVHPVAERLRQSLIDVFDETKRKRPAFDEPTDGLSDAKRQRLGAETDLPSQEAPFPPNAGPVTFAQLFTLEKDATLSGIDVTQIPPEMAAQVVFGLLTSISATQLDHSLNVNIVLSTSDQMMSHS